MAELVSTPYRLYYLLNNDFITGGNPNNRCIWKSWKSKNILVDGHDNLFIDTEFDDPDDFYSLKVCPYIDVFTISYDSSPDDIRIEKMDPMPWNDLSQDIVDAISDHYDLIDKNGENYHRIVTYADFIESLVEHPEDIVSVSFDEHKLPRIEIKGLTYICPIVDMNVTIQAINSGRNFSYTIGFETGESYNFTLGDLLNYQRKSRSYDGIRDLIREAVNDPIR